MSGTAVSPAPTSGQQWIRKGSLIVAASAQSGATNEPALDLSQFRYTFNIRQQDAQSPNSAVIRVYNLADSTVQQIKSEFQRVVVQAGYINAAYGVIFDGTIKQTRSGRERNVDSYLDILATEGDLPYNFGVINTTLAAGATPADQIAAMNSALGPFGTSINGNGLIGGTLPRGKVLFGMSMLHLDTLTSSSGSTWVVNSDGSITVIPLTGYLPGEAVVLNSQTGLVGVPESTQSGIQLLCLLNPKIRIGTQIQINNALINQTNDNTGNTVASYDDPFAGAFASVTADGFYRVIVNEYEGDSRGNPWYNRIVALALDPSAPAGSSVPLYPGVPGGGTPLPSSSGGQG